MSLVKWMNGRTGRAARVVAGLALIVGGLLAGGAGGVTLAVVGLLPLAAGAFGVCAVAPLMRVSPRAH